NFKNQIAANSAGQTLDKVTINVGNATNGDTIAPAFSGGTLTIGVNTTIVSSSTGALATFSPGFGTTTELLGTIEAMAYGGTFSINGQAPGPSGTPFDNDGQILVGNGDTLSVTSIISGGTGTVGIGTGGVANFTTTVAASQTLAFSDTT